LRCGPLMAGALTVAWELQPGVSQLAAQQIIAEHRGGGGTSIQPVWQVAIRATAAVQEGASPHAAEKKREQVQERVDEPPEQQQQQQQQQEEEEDVEGDAGWMVSVVPMVQAAPPSAGGGVGGLAGAGAPPTLRLGVTLVEGVRPSASYDLCVRAVTDHGCGRWAHSVAPVHTRLAPPIVLGVVDAEPDSLSLEWAMPSSYSAADIAHLQFQCQAFVDKASLPEQVSPSELLAVDDGGTRVVATATAFASTQANLKGLVPGRYFHLRVRAQHGTAEGMLSEFSAPVRARTTSAITHRVDDVTASTAAVSWALAPSLAAGLTEAWRLDYWLEPTPKTTFPIALDFGGDTTEFDAGPLPSLEREGQIVSPQTLVRATAVAPSRVGRGSGRVAILTGWLAG
jgi:hypothetical protein